MLAEVCSSSFLLGLPDDVFAIISRYLTPRDICNLSLCCRGLCALVDSEKVWLTQCDVLGIVPPKDLIEWRRGVQSFRALCRFLASVKPLIGIWVHQNPELGNVVYVIPGFVSVVGCRVIPQEHGPLGMEDGPILWAPVFEIIGNADGSSCFFLHGREKGNDYLYPGSVKAVDRNCNVLLLEIETRQQKNENKLMHSKSFAYNDDKEISRRVSRSHCELSRSQRAPSQLEIKIPFGRLNFSDRRKLIEIVTIKVRLNLPDSASGPLFPRLRNEDENFQNDMVLLFARRSLILQMNKLSGGYIDWKPVPELPNFPTQLQSSEIRKNFVRTNDTHSSSNGDEGHQQSIKKKTLRFIKQILGRSTSMNGNRSHSKCISSSSESKHAQLHDFLRSSDTIGLSLHACKMKLTSYRAWPNMHDSQFALYKLPMWDPKPKQEFAGLWGGTFGWPPGKPSEDKPGKALFLLLISYEEIEGKQLIATKILEGTHYVLHPNGSAMFMVNIEEPSLDPFPWETDPDSIFNVKHAFTGEGIANGYGFRYPGSKPGSLYVFQSGLLAFIWQESKAVLTLQRLNLQELLRKGEKVPALPPIANFSYLTKSYSNVFAGFSNASNRLSSPRQRNL